MKVQLALIAAVVTMALAIVGIVAADRFFGREDNSSNGQDWEMFGQRVAAGASQSIHLARPVAGEVFLYNKRTGKVYRYFGTSFQSIPTRPDPDREE